MTGEAALTSTESAAVAETSPPPRRLARRRPLLFFLPYLVFAPTSLAAQISLEKVELNAQLDPKFQALYAKAMLVLRNRSRESQDVLVLTFPEPAGFRVRVGTVWDRQGELAWRADPAEEDEPRILQIALRSPLTPGKKQLVVVNYDMNLKDWEMPGRPVELSRDGARLWTTGWYPLPARSASAVPQRLRLVVRLPKEWRVNTSAALKRLRNGTTLASYVIRLQRVEPGQLLLRAESPLPR